MTSAALTVISNIVSILIKFLGMLQLPSIKPGKNSTHVLNCLNIKENIALKTFAKNVAISIEMYL